MEFEPATVRWLLAPAGQAALTHAADLDWSDGALLASLDRLRRQLTGDRAAAVAETLRLRARARTKFRLADHLYFTHEALEQAAHEDVAAHVAQRLAGFGRVAELGCGIGGDSLALAGVARLFAYERGQARALMARANLAACGLAASASVVVADVTTLPAPRVDALFVDPVRRAHGQRRFRLADGEPSWPLLAAWQTTVPALAMKVAPGIGDEEIPPGAEVEFVALHDDLKAAVLWLGPLVRAKRSATLLPSGVTLSGHGRPAPIRQAEPAGYLYEPNPALIRAHLLDQVAMRLAAWQIDPTIAYLCAAAYVATPLARAYRVDDWFPFNLHEARRRLRALDVGPVTVKKRGSPLEPAEFARQLRLTGRQHRVVVLTRVAGRPAVVICQEIGPRPPGVATADEFTSS